MEEQEQLTNRARKELLHQEREAQKESVEGRRNMKRMLKWGIGIIVVVGAIIGIVILSLKGAKPLMGEEYSNLGQQHIAVGATHAEYNSNPPTSGPHYLQPARWGVYQEELPDEQLIHNLEHGGIWISYRGLDAATIAKIEDIAKRYPNKLIVTPRAKNDSPIVLASWRHVLALQSFDEQTIVDFVKANKNKSPEPNAK